MSSKLGLRAPPNRNLELILVQKPSENIKKTFEKSLFSRCLPHRLLSDAGPFFCPVWPPRWAILHPSLRQRDLEFAQRDLEFVQRDLEFPQRDLEFRSFFPTGCR